MARRIQLPRMMQEENDNRSFLEIDRIEDTTIDELYIADKFQATHGNWLAFQFECDIQYFDLRKPYHVFP